MFFQTHVYVWPVDFLLSVTTVKYSYVLSNIQVLEYFLYMTHRDSQSQDVLQITIFTLSEQ